MRFKHMLAVIAGAAIAAPAMAANDTPIRLRLESIEARLPDVGRLAELEDKVQRLAQAQDVDVESGSGSGGSAGGGALFNLHQDVQALTEDVRRMRGEIDELEHRADQREQRQRDLYQNLDERLKAVEQEVGIKSGASAGGSAGESGDSGNGNGASGGPAQKAAAEKAYLAAFDQLKAGKYEKARSSFQSFVENYPNSEYGDNAWYWLGEARYVDRQYETALSAFQKVIDDYPDSQKVPGALYKRGVILDEQGQYDAARKALQKVIDQYPDDNAAELARKRLQAMDSG